MKKGYLYIALTTIIFSTMEIALKFVSSEFNPIQLTFLRFFIGGFVLFPFALKTLHTKKLSISFQDFYFFVFLGLLGTVISMGLYQLAVLNTQASVVAVLFSSNPVFVTILAFFILKEVIHKNNIMALILEIIGIILIINPLNIELNVVGVSLTIASTLIFALYGVCGKKKCVKYGGIVVTCFGFILGSFELLTFILISHITLVSHFLSRHGFEIFSAIPVFSRYSLRTLPILAYICIINTGIGFACYFKSMEETSAQTTSLVFFFKPILAPILALILLHEAIPFNMLLGILFILLGSLSSILPGLIQQKNHVDNTTDNQNQNDLATKIDSQTNNFPK